MRKNLWCTGLMLLAVAGLAFSQGVQQKRTLSVSGQPGKAPVLQVNGKSYVEVEALARIANASIAFKGNQITLKLPPSATITPTAASSVSQPANSVFSKDFLKAGIEEMTVIREWRSALINAVQNGYPLTGDVMGVYRGQAATSLRLASVAASTESDRNAFQLLSNEFDNMQKLSDKILAARKNMNYISRDVLKDDPLDQQILICARSLASMAASGQFQDDASCH